LSKTYSPLTSYTITSV